METKKVEIFSTDTCHFCHMAKEWLESKGVPFIEYNVGTDTEKRKEMMEMTGQLGVPVVRIGDNVMIGFNPDQMAKILEIAD
ncbi:MAG: glutaredoxin family protein [Candidatus Pacebacteria bacterium]|nr:glutaredoxin family protein [Candidatus Paceibacterota bacterium]MBP9866923.1 glutaredoxin family protein [Candidatus Paceibacterota bacterium]